MSAGASSERIGEFNPGWRRSLGLVLLAAGVVRLIHWCVTLSTNSLADLLILDSRVYDEMANAMLTDGFMGGDEVFHTSPLYPYLISRMRAFSLGGMPALFALQHVMALGSVALVARITRIAFGISAALPAAALFAFYGAGAMLETKLMPSTLGVLLALLSLSGLLEAASRRSIAIAGFSGIALGATCLVRPNTILFVPFAALWLGWAIAFATPRALPRIRRASIAALVFAAGAALAMAPPVVRNSSIEGEWVSLTAHGGMTFYQGNNAAATGIYSAIPGTAGNPGQLGQELLRIAEQESGRALKFTEVDRMWRDRALEFLREDPLRAAALVARKVRFWLGNDEISTEYVLATERILTPSLWLMPVPFALILALAVLGVYRTLCKSTGLGAGWLLFGFVVANVASTALFYFSSRYRLPAVAALCSFAGLGAVWVADLTKRLRSGDVVARHFAPLLVALSVLLFSVHSFTDDYERYAAKQWFTYGLVYDERAEPALALESFRYAAERLGDQWHVQYALARAYGKVGESDSAIRHYERALKLRPQSLDVRRGLEHERAKRIEPSP